MNKSKKLLIVVALMAGSTYADLSIESECDAVPMYVNMCAPDAW